jgi:hypothetical protein
MTDKIKSTLTTSYLMFVFDFGDPTEIGKSAIETKITFPISEVFKSQKRADSAREKLGKEGFNKMLSLYFAKYQTQDGFDYVSLGEELTKHKKVFLRFLGKDKVAMLTLMINTMASLKEPKKGLLYGDAS